MTKRKANSTKARRAKKDPAEPRNPKCSYIQFVLGKRVDFIKAHPKLGPKLVMKELGKQWKAASSAERKPYVDAGEIDKKRYKDEMAAYAEKTTPGVARTARSRKRRCKDVGAPLNPMSAYTAFIKLERPKLIAAHPDLNSQEAIKRLSAKWRGCTAAQKAAAVALAAKDSVRYKLEKAAYRKPPVTRTSPAGVAAPASLESRPRKKRQQGGPKMPSGAYIFFVKDQHARIKASNPTLTRQGVMRNLGTAWRQLDGAGRKKYMDLRDADKTRYGVECAAWKLRQLSGSAPTGVPAAAAAPVSPPLHRLVQASSRATRAARKRTKGTSI
jgi:hypothetical protein